MLGQAIEDPEGVEGTPGTTEGLGLLPVTTRLGREKEISRVVAENVALPFLEPGTPISGYEIHMGRTAVSEQSLSAMRILSRNGALMSEADGCVDPLLPVWGCYLHGIFDSPDVRRGLYGWLLARRGLAPQGLSHLGRRAPEAAVPTGSDPLDALADWLESRCNPVSLLGDP
jgi:adenosylcobyric acid synthase